MPPPTSKRRAGARPRAVRIDATTAVELDDVLQFMRTLWVAVHALQKASKRMNRTIGLTGPQRLVLRVVGLAPGISAGALAKVLHLHPSTLTGVLHRLESQRLLSRVQDARDARRAVLRLSPRGERLNVATEGTVESAARIVLAQVPPSTRNAAGRVLALLAGVLDVGGAPPRMRTRR